tara:strand:- start:290 stop:694 length:405 start_codon:yes stop_codon:yes gene_type:complete
MLVNLVWAAFGAAMLFACYWFLIRPVLRQRSEVAGPHGISDVFWTNAGFWFKGLKTKLAAHAVMLVGVLVGMHDFLLPFIISTDMTPLTGKVPAWVWPIVTVAVGALFSYLRTITTGPVESKGSLTISSAVRAD